MNSDAIITARYSLETMYDILDDRDSLGYEESEDSEVENQGGIQEAEQIIRQTIASSESPMKSQTSS